VLLDGRTRFLIRLDEEFVLVYDPQGKAMPPNSNPSKPIPLPQSTPDFSYLRRVEPWIQVDLEGPSTCEPVASGMVSVLARKVIKAAR
jgi:hypothetical protein